MFVWSIKYISTYIIQNIIHVFKNVIFHLEIERGTDGSQASENWAVLMEVCDIINETDEG